MELDFVRWLRSRLPVPPVGWLGIGDDAAIVPASSNGLAVTTDLLIDGVHFRTGEHSPERIGRKALAVNLSDLAAMAANPQAAVVALALPQGLPGGSDEFARRLYERLLPLAKEFGVAMIGGDTNRTPGPLVISITAWGTVEPPGPLLRSSAQVGDIVMVTGRFGGSLLGKHLDFVPRVAEARCLSNRYRLHAGMDVTDGLALDASRLADASGVGVVLDLSHIPIDPAAQELAHCSGRAPLAHALGDGEDFELLFTLAVAEAERLLTEQPLACRVSAIGEVTDRPGLWQRSATGELSALAATGYEH